MIRFIFGTRFRPDYAPKSPYVKRVQSVILYSKLYSISVLLLVFGLSPLQAQVSAQRLKCHGEMPDDFRLRYTDRYQQTLQTTDDFDARRKTSSKEEFAAFTNIAIDNLIRSGKVLYGDEVTRYCNAIKDALLFNDTALSKELRIYTLRSDQVNAFSTHQGIILVTTGLVARMENEAQLAFVIAHEIAHYVKKHVVEGYQYNKELFNRDVNNKKSSLDEKVLESAQYSRQAELEADEFGFDLYTRAGYNPEQVIYTHNLLLHAAFPIENIELKFENLEDGYFKIKKPATEYARIPIEADEQIDDSRGTHPNIFKRKVAIFDKLSKQNFPDAITLYKFDEGSFARMVDKAKLDVLFCCLMQNQYVEGLMLCDAWLDSSNLDRQFLMAARAMCFYGIQTFYNEFQNTIIHGNLQFQGPQNSYYHFFKSLTYSELNSIVVREIWKMVQEDTTNKTTRAILNQSLFQMAKNSRINPDLNRLAEAESRWEEAFSTECHTCEMAFRDSLFQPLGAIYIPILESYQAYYSAKLFAEQNPEIKEEPKIERMLLLSPTYFGMDLRKPVDKRFLRADREQKHLEETTRELAEKLGIELVIPDSRENRDSMTEEFNHFVTLVDWMNEAADFEGDQFYSFLHDDIEEIKEAYGTDYMAVTMYWNLIETRPFNIGVAAISIMIPYCLPFYLYWQLTPRTRTSYAFILANLNNEKLDYVEVKNFKARYRNYLIRGHLYNSLNQIRK